MLVANRRLSASSFRREGTLRLNFKCLNCSQPPIISSFFPSTMSSVSIFRARLVLSCGVGIRGWPSSSSSSRRCNPGGRRDSWRTLSCCSCFAPCSCLCAWLSACPCHVANFGFNGAEDAGLMLLLSLLPGDGKMTSSVKPIPLLSSTESSCGVDGSVVFPGLLG